MLIPGAVITAQSVLGSGYTMTASISSGMFVWTSPPHPVGGASHTDLPLEFTATEGGHSTTTTITFRIQDPNVNVVAPSFGQPFPEQHVFEPYTPPAGAPNPTLKHNFAFNLSDYLASGTQPVTFHIQQAANVPGRSQLTNRFSNGQPIHDHFSFVANQIDQSVEDTAITITATNSAGSDSAIIRVSSTNLSYPTWTGSQTLNVCRLPPPIHLTCVSV